jgi:hypothetical protein
MILAENSTNKMIITKNETFDETDDTYDYEYMG